MTKEKIDFIKKNKKMQFLVTMLTLFVINAFRASHAIKLFKLFSVRV